MIRGWHFVGTTLRDGRPVPADGVWLEHDGPLVMCASGLHAGLTPFDALQYAPEPTLCLVDCDSGFLRDSDKIVCRRRRIVVRMDTTEMLWHFARMQALSVVHLWEAPDVMLDYLMTGKESIRHAARAAARAARAAGAAGAAEAAGAAARPHGPPHGPLQGPHGPPRAAGAAEAAGAAARPPQGPQGPQGPHGPHGPPQGTNLTR